MTNFEKYTCEGILTFYPHKIISVDDKQYILSRSCSGIFEVDGMFWDIVKFDNHSIEDMWASLSNKYTSSEILNELASLEENYLIKSARNDELIAQRFNLEKIKSKKIHAIVLMLCHECNLRCTYCYAENGEYHNKGRMSTEVGKKSIDFLFDNCGESEKVSVVFFGGEPLIRKDLLKELTIYAKQIAKEKNKKIYFSVTTNATLIDEELSEFFAENSFSLTVSIDGNKETTDTNRFYANKTGAYNDIVKGYGVVNKKVSATARGTVTSESLNILESWNHLYQLKFKSIHLAHSTNMLNDEDYSILAENYKKLIDLFHEAIIDKDIKKATRMSNVFTMISKIHNGGVRFKSCGTLNNMLAVDIQGKLYPCHRFVSYHEMQVGDIYSGLDENVYDNQLTSMLLTNYSSCIECWAMNICGGCCPQENYALNGKANEPHPLVCKMLKEICEYSVQMYLKLDDEQRSLLFD